MVYCTVFRCDRYHFSCTNLRLYQIALKKTKVPEALWWTLIGFLSICVSALVSRPQDVE